MGFPTKKNVHFGVFLGVPPFKETPIESPLKGNDPLVRHI